MRITLIVAIVGAAAIAMALQPILRLTPYKLNPEYRVEGVDTLASMHEMEAEMIYVIDGACIFVTGGKLAGEKRTNATNLTGSLVTISIHVPRSAGAL
jgi:hypothetical protein